MALHTDLWHREYRIETDMSPLVVNASVIQRVNNCLLSNRSESSHVGSSPTGCVKIELV